ncbi:MAG: TIGR01212 family radical SAM protein [Muribaculaceae bacterium]|nr:TIGR01212 family radical SAM protein [Roseburia sp.]MCM1431580.1 TIGR01212 family radical SAM protein [Muribaculaceae bacterium]MCM1492045.1 TIGR01212 family radical SAM protein [Muribaculaceae bacterium]
MKIYTLNQYLRDTFGEKVYKLAIDRGFTCPNRDGTLDTRGCIFCSGAGSGEFSGDRTKSISEQLALGKNRVANKLRDGKYIAYFQAFTNTYAPIERLDTLYGEALKHKDVVALSVATRPDCLSEDVVALLAEKNRQKPVWVELGLQTIHEETAAYIRRGYPLSVFDDAVRRLKASGLQVIVHVILGLPYETETQMKQTVSYVGKSGADGIKLQLLHVIRGTDLEREYRLGRFQTLSLEEYVRLVADCLALLPEDMVIHRMTGDGDRRTLVAPLWSTDKKRVLNALHRAIAEKESV